MKKDTFCPIPWNFQAIQNNGTVRVCCQMNVSKTRGTLFKDDGTPYNAARDNLTEARNAEFIKDVRKHMMEGRWHPDCGRCRQEEEAGLDSRRNWESIAWPSINIDYVQEHTDENGQIDVDNLPLTYYDLRFGNFCNLACRMCGPEDSHTWYKDWVEIHGSVISDTHGRIELQKNEKGRWVTDAYDWHGSESFWDQIESNLSNIAMVYMAGGEPMLIERHYEFLQKCIDADVAKQIVIEYNTNLTNVQPRVLELWKHFKMVRIGASIDGYGEVLEFQRHPAKWKTIEKNLRIIDDLPDNVTAWISATVTIVNLFHIPDFMLWKLEQGFKKINCYDNKPIITHHVSHRPWSNCIRVLPPDVKQEAVDLYNEKRKEFAKYGSHIEAHANKILDSIINYMVAVDESDKMPKFIHFHKPLDKLRNQDLTKVVPQYTKLFTTEYIQEMERKRKQ